MTEHSIDRRRNSSDRNPVEEELKEQYSTLRSIIDSANALIFSVDYC